MKALLQRVKSASVTVDGKLVSSIGKGVLVFAAIAKEDTAKDVESAASKVLKFKLWDDEEGGKWKRSVVDIEGEVLCVSQFTLLASTKKKHRPDFHKSADGQKAKELYKEFFNKVKELYEPDKVKDGIFQAMMDVTLVNDGPVGIDYACVDGEVTLEIDTAPPKSEGPAPEGSTINLEDLMGKIQKEFVYPVELLQ